MTRQRSPCLAGPSCFRNACRLGLLWLAVLALPAAASNLVGLAPVTVPALTQAPSRLIAIDGGAVALGQDQAWQLDGPSKAWRPLRWSVSTPVATVRSAASEDHRLWLLTGEPGGDLTLMAARIEGGSIVDAGPIPPPPSALRDGRLSAAKGMLTLAGTDTAGKPQVFQHDDQGWHSLPAWPGGGQVQALLAQGTRLYLATGNAQAPQLASWSRGEGWRGLGALPGAIVPGSAQTLGQAHLMFLLQGQPDLRTFHTITHAWNRMPLATASQAVQATAMGNGLIWSDGGGQLQSAVIESGKYLLKWQDWAVIVVYLVSVIGIGGYFYLREKRQSTSDFFVGGRSIPFWAAGISLYATNTSSISFIAIPAKAFETNWQYMTNNLIAVLGLMFVAVWIVPLLRRLNLMSVFSYLETRFHPGIRMLASALCIAMQVGARMSVILFLPALAIATITGISVALSVVLMGVFTIIYTAMGGMKAVIWTDVVQVIVKMGGAIFAIGFIIWHLPGGMPEFFDVAMADQKMKTFDFSFDLTKATVWGFVFLVLFDVVLTFPKDQVLMQRTLSTSSAREAGRSIWAFAAIMIPGGLVFYSIGTALFVYYKAHPERLNPTLPIDATFPLFIAAELPTGVTGLIVAGIFAAAMATLSSIMNSVATLVSVDFYERLVKQPDQRRSVLFAEITTVVVGLVGIGLALLMSRYDIHSLFDVSIELAGLLGGGFAGSYTLGMFTRRANSPGVAIGIGGSIVLTFVAWWYDLVHPYFYLGISILLSIVIGYIASLFFPRTQRSLDGLTIYRDAE